MISIARVPRRTVLRGMLGGAAVTVGVPLLDCFLNTNGTALADGAPLPKCFSTWYWQMGLTPGFWEPKVVGAGYEMPELLSPLKPFRDKINIYSGMAAFLDGKNNLPHTTGRAVAQTGEAPAGQAMQAGGPPGVRTSLDCLIADAIGTRTRFRSLEVCAGGKPQDTNSRRGAGAVNPAEVSPRALYTRVFGPEFQDPNAADFKPDAEVILRRSALSAVTEQRKALMRSLGASDRARLEQYFASLRDLEHQLELQLQKPAPLEACHVPSQIEEQVLNEQIENVTANHRLFARILANAMACGQTQVANVFFGSGGYIRKSGIAESHHIRTHEESVDHTLGYQPDVHWFHGQIIVGFSHFLAELEAIQEGEGTLLDRSIVYASSDVGYAKNHTTEHLPMITAGKAGGALKTGLHVPLAGETVARVGLTVQQALGVPVTNWGYEANKTNKTITEVLA